MDSMADKPSSNPQDRQLRVDAQSGPARRALAGSQPAGSGSPAHPDIDFLFTQAEQALASAEAETAPDGQPPVVAYHLRDFAGAPASTEATTLDRIRDVELDLKIELGRTQMALEDVLKLRAGSVVPLDRLAGDPVDILVNGRLIARGEVLVLHDKFCVRVAELIGEQRATSDDDRSS
jgi:flagellar motor switch protein FliN/FliY